MKSKESHEHTEGRADIQWKQFKDPNQSEQYKIIIACDFDHNLNKISENTCQDPGNLVH